MSRLETVGILTEHVWENTSADTKHTGPHVVFVIIQGLFETEVLNTKLHKSLQYLLKIV